MMKIAKVPKNVRISIAILFLFAFLFCLPALAAPFWGDKDAWSNLLPVVHYRISILEELQIPLYTELWYGGWAQWQNPLWSFLYFPATLFWLILPLHWGTRVVLFGHFLFSLLAGRKLASLFLKNEGGRVAAAIVLTSPMLPALLAVHFEKILGWGWLLLSLYFVLNKDLTDLRRGLFSGLCWGVIGLTGDNYHVFYAGIVLIPLVLSFKKSKLWYAFVGGASIGLLHLPSVWHLAGVGRANPADSLEYWRMSPLGVIGSLTTGLAKPFSPETWALIGILIAYLFVRSLYIDIKGLFWPSPGKLTPQKIALLISTTILILMAIGALYQGHNLLDTFRVPARAVALVATTLTLYVLLGTNSDAADLPEKKPRFPQHYWWMLSAIQVVIFSFLLIQPQGSVHSPYDPTAQQIADSLKAAGADSVWVSFTNRSDMYLDVALTRNGISLPNVYYGDMGQQIKVSGPYCGYSFDFLLSPIANNNGTSVILINAMTTTEIAQIPLDQLKLIDQVRLDSKKFEIYQVICHQ